MKSNIPAQILKDVEKAVDEVITLLATRQFINIFGNTGVGKTLTSASVAKLLIDNGEDVVVVLTEEDAKSKRAFWKETGISSLKVFSAEAFKNFDKKSNQVWIFDDMSAQEGNGCEGCEKSGLCQELQECQGYEKYEGYEEETLMEKEDIFILAIRRNAKVIFTDITCDCLTICVFCRKVSICNPS